jgi:hypothetical protein
MQVTGNDGQPSGLVPPAGYGVWGDGGLEPGAQPLDPPVFGTGVVGTSHGIGVEGITDAGTGVTGRAVEGVGIRAQSVNNIAMVAASQSGRAIVATSSTQDAINGTSSAGAHAGYRRTTTHRRRALSRPRSGSGPPPLTGLASTVRGHLRRTSRVTSW